MIQAEIDTRSSHHPRKRYRGKMVSPSGDPRSMAYGKIPGKSDRKNRCKPGTGGGKPPVYECGQDKAYTTKFIPGHFKVSMIKNRQKYMGYN